MTNDCPFLYKEACEFARRLELSRGRGTGELDLDLARQEATVCATSNYSGCSRYVALRVKEFRLNGGNK